MDLYPTFMSRLWIKNIQRDQCGAIPKKRLYLSWFLLVKHDQNANNCVFCKSNMHELCKQFYSVNEQIKYINELCSQLQYIIACRVSSS